VFIEGHSITFELFGVPGHGGRLPFFPTQPGWISGVHQKGVRSAVDAAAEKHAIKPEGKPELAELIDDIDEVFALDTWAEIKQALPAHTQLAEDFAKLTEKASPSSLVAATELFAAEAKAKDVREALRMELALGKHMLRRPDFVEGVRAVLVDKTHDAAFPAAGEAAEFREVIANA
ncbi:enoyl-CoA hydratase/isomerase family protein, partial [Corynebacterium simulans]